MSGVRTEKTVSERWQDAHREIERRKQADAAASDVIYIYNNQTANTWDVVNAFLDGTHEESKWLVTFTPDEVPLYWYFTEFAVSFQMVTNPQSYDEGSLDYWDDPATELVMGYRRYVVWFRNDLSDQAINLKFSVKAPVKGTLTWTRLI